ncbi:hypothetical protein Dip510_000555 [Elusimicrobium posterum]|uniref:zinc ribbon domain-containing protein n=1 Tax=Elusimicrobium posterum TaxID=3116653 RepID=UPI003C746EB4
MTQENIQNITQTAPCPLPAQKECWKCKKNIDAQDNYCRYCGSGFGKYVAWYYQVWGIIVLLFCIGPFALYNVWFSPLLSKKAKWIFTAVIIAFTFLAIYQLYMFMSIMLGNLDAILSGNLDGVQGYF